MNDEATRPPAKSPCGSCPYRRDVASGIWASEEYGKLPRYDRETAQQPVGLFLCHQQDGRVCAGWAGCHDMSQSLALRVAALSEDLDPAVVDAVLDYQTRVPLWASGQEAATHGLAGIAAPDTKAQRVIGRLLVKQSRRTEDS